GVEPPGEGPHQVAGVGVAAVADPAGQRERAGEGELDGQLCLLPREREVRGQPQAHALARRIGQRPRDRRVVVVVVVGLGPVRDVDAGDAGEQVVDVVVAAELPVGDDVEPGELLVLERGLDGDLVDLVEVLGADPALVVVGLEPLEPLGHRVGADDRGGEQRVARGHGHHSRTWAVRVWMFAPGRAPNGAMWTSYPRRLPMSWSSGPLTQFTTEPSYLPGP